MLAFTPVWYSVDIYGLKKVYYKLQSLISSPLRIPPDAQRTIFRYPDGGYETSLETALNSRCTSDYDLNSKKSHWGIFDSNSRLADDQIEEIIQFVRVPRFTSNRVAIKRERNLLTFVVENSSEGIVRDWLMIESGMQQQAVCLVCAALGVGTVFKSFGKDVVGKTGKPLSEEDYGVVKIKLDAMAPSYEGGYWSEEAPGDLEEESLPLPKRTGSRPLIDLLQDLESERPGAVSRMENISQLLWAARGRTPHFYNSRPWGMTIPASRGDQEISSIYLVWDSRLFGYVNRDRAGPKHSLNLVGKIGAEDNLRMQDRYYPFNCFLIIGANEEFPRALWEAGFQILNSMLQAKALDVNYKTVLFDDGERDLCRKTGIQNPLCALCIRAEEALTGRNYL